MLKVKTIVVRLMIHIYSAKLFRKLLFVCIDKA